MLVGQEKLRVAFEEMIREGKLPQFIVLEGEVGSGRKTFADFIVEKMDAFMYVLPDLKVDNIRVIIDDAQTLNAAKFYLICDAENMTPQAENALLKLAEEPPAHCHIIMTVDNRASVLPTIQSRAKVYTMQPYSQDEMMQFTKDLRLVKLCSTPGQVLSYLNADMESLFKFAEKVIENVGKVTIMNMLAILNYVDVDGKNPDKYSVELLMSVLLYKLGVTMKQDKAQRKACYGMMNAIREAKSLLKVRGTNKQGVMDKMLVEMRRAVKTA